MVARPTDDDWRAAFLRISNGQSSETDEAKRLGVHKSTVSRKVKELGAQRPATGATGATNATKATSEGKSGAAQQKTPLEIAREAAAGAAAPEVAKAVAEGQLADARFCIETLQGYKSAGVYLVAQFSGVPPNAGELPHVAALSEMAKGVIAQNAHWLAPALRSQSSEMALYAILGIEAFLAWVMVKGLARKYAPPEPPEETPAPAPPPSPTPGPGVPQAAAA